MKIPHLSGRKLKVLMKRTRENSIKLCAGLHCGSGAAASAPLSSVQGVHSQPGTAVFAATAMPGGMQLGTAAVPETYGCYRLWGEMKLFLKKPAWSERQLRDVICLSTQTSCP